MRLRRTPLVLSTVTLPTTALSWILTQLPQQTRSPSDSTSHTPYNERPKMADAIQQIKAPYELLFRWADDGALQGAHVVWLLRILDGNGNLISSQTSEAQSVAVAGSEGF